MLAGNDQVAGELWRFAADVMPRLIEVIDQIEVTDQPGLDNLYDRVIVDVFDSDDLNKSSSPVSQAFAYHYARDPVADGFEQIMPGQGHQAAFVRWP